MGDSDVFTTSYPPQVQRGTSLKPIRAGVLLFPLPLRFMFIQRNLQRTLPLTRGW